MVPVLLAALAGCTAPAPWTVPSPPRAGAEVAAGPCPDLAGTYVNVAEAGKACSALDAKACQSLTFYFFSAHVPEAAGVSNDPTLADDWPAATHVRIEQPAAGVLRIVALDVAASGEARTVATRMLDRRHGEFACEAGAVHLKPRIQQDAVLWAGRRTNSEYLAVSRDPDALVVTSQRSYDSYILWLLGGTMRQEQSRLRWGIGFPGVPGG